MTGTCAFCREDAPSTLSRNAEAERAVLGVLLIASDRLPEVSDSLRSSHFYAVQHAIVYEAMLRLGLHGGRFDVVTLSNALRIAKQLKEVGGPAYLSSLTDGVPRGTNLGYYARVVMDHALRRALVETATRSATRALEAESADEALDATEKEVYDLSAARVAGTDFVDTNGLLAAAEEVLGQISATGHPVTGVETGLLDLDTMTRGMHAGQLVVVAGRPGKGKSAFGMNVARHAARTVTVLYFSLEMSREELGMRLVITESQQDGHRIQSGTIPQSAWAAIGLALGTLRETTQPRLIVEDAPHRTVSQIRSLARRVKAATPTLRLLVIDYLGLMGVDRDQRRKDGVRTLEIGDMTRGLKLLAKELRLPILVLCQLSREPEKRTAKQQRPKLSDLAESGAIEKDADQVWFIHQGKDDANEDQAEIIIAKNRSGPKGIVHVAYFESQYRFANRAHDTEEVPA